MTNNRLLNILFCDDNAQFAAEQIEILNRKLKTVYGFDSNQIHIQAVTQLNEVNKLIKDNKKLSEFDLIFCDLGWSDLNLNGIQLCHDIQIAHPDIFAVLYTAQDEDAIISQALSWQLDFIDCIIRIDGHSYFNEMISTIENQFNEKVIQLIQNNLEVVDHLQLFLDSDLDQNLNIIDKKSEAFKISNFGFYDYFPRCRQLAKFYTQLSSEQISQILEYIENLLNKINLEIQDSSFLLGGTKYLQNNFPSSLKNELSNKVKQFQKEIKTLTQNYISDDIALEFTLSQKSIEFKLKPDPTFQQNKRYIDLIEKLDLFPRLDRADLLALDKSKYIQFIKEKYGGFPELASQRGLDLNNIYRVNRRFKNHPFIVFQFDTISEIVGIADSNLRLNQIQKLLASKLLIKNNMKLNTL